MTPATKPASLADAIRTAILLMELDAKRHKASADEFAEAFPTTAELAAHAWDERLVCLDDLRAALPRAEAADALAVIAERACEAMEHEDWPIENGSVCGTLRAALRRYRGDPQ